nr:hypothetical protein [uncultured Pedobacter sp.]
MENISWTTFGIGITLLILSYYLVVFIYCYWQELSTIFPKTSNADFNPLFIGENDSRSEVSAENAVEAEEFEQPTSENLEVDTLIEALKEGIGFASDHEYQPLAFKAHLSSIIKKFPQLNGSDHQSAINELLVKECKEYGVMVLSQDDAVHLWNSNP